MPAHRLGRGQHLHLRVPAAGAVWRIAGQVRSGPLEPAPDGWPASAPLPQARSGCDLVSGRLQVCIHPTEVFHAQVAPDVTVVMIGAWEVLDHLIDGVAIRFPDPAWLSVHAALGLDCPIGGATT